MASGAAFADGFMLEGKWTTLLGMALCAGVVGSGNGTAALVWIMTITAAHFAGEHWVAIGHREIGFLIKVALEAGFRGFLGIDNGSRAAAGGDVLAAGAVAGFAADVLRIGTLGLKFGVIRGAEVAGDFFMALRAGIGADKGGTR